jgi:hypothetical protein
LLRRFIFSANTKRGAPGIGSNVAAATSADSKLLLDYHLENVEEAARKRHCNNAVKMTFLFEAIYSNKKTATCALLLRPLASHGENTEQSASRPPQCSLIAREPAALAVLPSFRSEGEASSKKHT